MDAYDFWKYFDIASEGQTLKSVTEKAGLNYKTIKNQRSSVRLPNLDDAYALSCAIGVSLEYLMTGKKGLTYKTSEARAVDEDPDLRAVVRAIMRDRKLLQALSAVIESGEGQRGSDTTA